MSGIRFSFDNIIMPTAPRIGFNFGSSEPEFRGIESGDFMDS